MSVLLMCGQWSSISAVLCTPLVAPSPLSLVRVSPSGTSPRGQRLLSCTRSPPLPPATAPPSEATETSVPTGGSVAGPVSSRLLILATGNTGKRLPSPPEAWPVGWKFTSQPAHVSGSHSLFQREGGMLKLPPCFPRVLRMQLACRGPCGSCSPRCLLTSV